MNRFHGIALTCALLPLVTGTVDFVLWLQTDDSGFAFAGLIIIALGLLLLLAGLVLLIFAARRDRREHRATRAPTLLVLAVLFLNLPVANAMYTRGKRHYFGFHVRVVNDSSARMSSMEFLDADGRSHPLGAIEPHTEERGEFLFEGREPVHFRVLVDGVPREGPLTNVVRLNADGTFSAF